MSVRRIQIFRLGISSDTGQAQKSCDLKEQFWLSYPKCRILSVVLKIILIFRTLFPKLFKTRKPPQKLAVIKLGPWYKSPGLFPAAFRPELTRGACSNLQQPRVHQQPKVPPCSTVTATAGAPSAGAHLFMRIFPVLKKWKRKEKKRHLAPLKSGEKSTDFSKSRWDC